jgi:hypothetical protein
MSTKTDHYIKYSFGQNAMKAQDGQRASNAISRFHVYYPSQNYHKITVVLCRKLAQLKKTIKQLRHSKRSPISRLLRKCHVMRLRQVSRCLQSAFRLAWLNLVSPGRNFQQHVAVCHKWLTLTARSL